MPRKVTQEQFIERAKQVHGNKYDYGKTEYEGTDIKISIMCPKHGEFLQTPHAHLNGQGCRKCQYEEMSIRQFSTTNAFATKANQIHNNKFDYSKVEYKSAKIRVCIICPIHGEFWQTPSDHIQKCGCPLCNTSKGEEAIRKYLIDGNIQFEEQKTFNDCRISRLLKFDFYLSEHNLCIEYDGQQHFKPFSWSNDKSRETKEKNLKLVQLRDSIKNQYCLENNIKLLRIPYFKFKNIDKILEGYFNV